MKGERYIMVLDENLVPMHPLTQKGEKEYHELLESIATEMIFKHSHPIKWFIEKAKENFSYICEKISRFAFSKCK